MEAKPRRSTERFPISPFFRLRTPSLPMGLWPRLRVSRLCVCGCGGTHGGVKRQLHTEPRLRRRRLPSSRGTAAAVPGLTWRLVTPGGRVGSTAAQPGRQGEAAGGSRQGGAHQRHPQVGHAGVRQLVVPQHQGDEPPPLLLQPLAEVRQAWPERAGPQSPARPAVPPTPSPLLWWPRVAIKPLGLISARPEPQTLRGGREPPGGDPHRQPGASSPGAARSPAPGDGQFLFAPRGGTRPGSRGGPTARW